jgi:alpha-tubulin suppressor-like RCC1 family protein
LGLNNFLSTNIPTILNQNYGDFNGRKILSISSGLIHSCGVLNDGSALCWGDNSKGEIGDASIINKNVPTEIYGILPGDKIIKILSGAYFSCALFENGKLFCWGDNT